MSDLLRRVLDRLLLGEGARPEPRSRLNDRPGALFADGRVGSTGARRTSTRPQPTQPARPTRPGPPGFVDSADAPTAEELPRRQRTAAAVRELRVTPRGRIILALHSPVAVRQAIVLREVLDPPVALRDERAPGLE
jgi:hypothetical protein